MTIKENLDFINKQIRETCVISDRNYDDVKLIAVTKSASIDKINELIKCGVKRIAESRVKRAKEIFENLSSNFGYDIEKHMIGHLQSNKVKTAVEIFDVIQSVDSLKLANKINKTAFEMQKVIKIMLQVNISNEKQKFGFNSEEIFEIYKKMLKFTNLKIIGIMAMAPFTKKENTRKYFSEAKKIFDELKLKELSIGMSNDFDIAIEEGATMIRVGRMIFN
ncbi:MAG: YggS family pyridoxal phosphate-dependent enzyme [Candidatus Woesearchaeota archaeon]